MHALNSDFTIGGQPACPGSAALYMTIAERFSMGDLTPATRTDVERAWREWQEAEADQRQRNKVMPTDPATRFQGWPMGSRPHGVDPTAFPPRAGDPGAPEEDWKPKETVLPPTQIGQPLGRAAMEDARSTHAALVNLTLNKIDETQGALANLTSMLHLVDGKVSEVAVHMATSMALCTAAIGSGHGINDAGREMASNLALAAAGETPDGTLRQHLAALQAATAATYTLLAQAVDRGRAYADTI